MSNENLSHWRFEPLAKAYSLTGITKHFTPPNFDNRFEFSLGEARLEFDFGNPDMCYIGERKMDYFMRMVSAAPQMLEALKALVAYEQENETEYLGMDQIRAYMKAKNAIAAAEGRAEG